MSRSLSDTQKLARQVAKRRQIGAKKKWQPTTYWGRQVFLMVVLLALPIVVIGRAAYIQWVARDFLQAQGDARTDKLSRLPALRGTITDRNGEELAISIPAWTAWMDVARFWQKIDNKPRWWSSQKAKALAELVGKTPEALKQWLEERRNRRFVYLSRLQRRSVRDRYVTLKIPGLNWLEEQKRYYPAGEVTAHVIGFTDIDGRGLEGIERAYDVWLQGQPGEQLLKYDLYGNVIERGEVLRAPKDGKNITLSIDLRVQSIAYLALKRAVAEHRAKAGSAVVLDVNTGEVLAMVNQPAYNPNNRASIRPGLTRNRALTDIFEPGSTFKPFVAAMALQTGQYSPESAIDTAPGYMKVNGFWVRDGHNNGKLTLTGVIQKSSNVGVAKIALALDTEFFVDTYYRLGFGVDTGTGFPGESAGKFQVRARWSDIEKATLAYGYGIGVTATQLARAYAVLANGGRLLPVSLVKVSGINVGERVLPKVVTRQVLEMMAHVVEEGGTGHRAAVKGYRVAGKTGTARKAINGGYGDDYVAVFSGIAPLDNPRIAVVVVIDSPQGEEYYGGDVAAPLFREIAARTLRWLGVPPDHVTQPLVAGASMTLEGDDG